MEVLKQDVKVVILYDFKNNCYLGTNFLRILKAKFDAFTAPMLQYPKLDEIVIIQTDASDTGIGAVLTQTIKG